jgi:ribosomal protein S18 acetylase RimI-like enzyme
VLDRAAAIGYHQVMLDTLPGMTAAIAIYRALGFEPIPPYGNAIVPGLLCFGKRLGERRKIATARRQLRRERTPSRAAR